MRSESRTRSGWYRRRVFDGFTLQLKRVAPPALRPVWRTAKQPALRTQQHLRWAAVVLQLDCSLPPGQQRAANLRLIISFDMPKATGRVARRVVAKTRRRKCRRLVSLLQRPANFSPTQSQLWRLMDTGEPISARWFEANQRRRRASWPPGCPLMGLQVCLAPECHH